MVSYMKKFFSIIVMIWLVLSFTVPAFAVDALNERTSVHPFEFEKIGTATLVDMEKEGGTMILTASSSPDATYQILDVVQNIYCKVADLPLLGDYLPGCEYVEFADSALKYVDSGVKVLMRLKDPTTGEVIGNPDGYTMSDGQTIWLGNDHSAYEIWFKQTGPMNYAFVRLAVGNNVVWEDAK